MIIRHKSDETDRSRGKENDRWKEKTRMDRKSCETLKSSEEDIEELRDAAAKKEPEGSSSMRTTQ